MSRFKDYTGQRFGRLECVSLAPVPRYKGNTYWTCKCDCGNLTDVVIRHLVDGATKSCGCLRREFYDQCNKLIARRFTPQQSILIRKMLKNGATPLQIAVDLQVARNTIIAIRDKKYY